ncbi:MAG: hypothetical protein JOZ96_17105 [Acidobacteria bacterium]|nr:hypothetical protein [Acidobacteriota bacterium]
MSTTARTQEVNGDPVPRVVGTWNVAWPTDSSPSLPTSLTDLRIEYQAPGASFDRIFGSLSSTPPDVTSYALRDGKINRLSDTSLLIFFVLRIDGEDHIFEGALSLSGETMLGEKPRVQFGHGGAGDGSWSAQAQSGG